MKADLKIASPRQSSRDDRPNDQSNSFPRIHFEFQQRSFGGPFGGQGSPRRRPGFTSLANEVLRSDASRTFRLETAILGVITLVSAWPIAVMIREVIRLLK